MAVASSLSLAAADRMANAGLATFSGLRATSSTEHVHGSYKLAIKRCARCGGSTARAESCSHTGAVASGGDSALFASVSQTSSPATSSGPTSSPFLPAVLGAGLLGAAGYALISSTQKKPDTSAVDQKSFLLNNGVLVPRAKSAATAAIQSMANNFPNAIQEAVFIQSIAAQLNTLGFRRDNCIALVNTCRDEVCRPIVNLIDHEFGLSFNISGLGGLVNCGKTGFKAAMSHSPEFPCDVDGTPKERYVFFAFPHVSVGETGEVGSLLRRGRGKPSSACGALIAIKGDISKGNVGGSDDLDAEYSLLKQKVFNKLPTSGGDDLNLAKVTKAALQAITEDLERLISLTVDPKHADYAVITGVQIHSGNQIPGQEFRVERTCDYIAPDTMYAVVRGEKYILPYESSKTVAAIA